MDENIQTIYESLAINVNRQIYNNQYDFSSDKLQDYDDEDLKFYRSKHGTLGKLTRR